jgi:hypothetical protein
MDEHYHDWCTMADLGIDIGLVIVGRDSERFTYKIINKDGTFIEFGPIFERDMLLGWTYASYDDEGVVLGADGGFELAEIAPHIVKFTR